MKHRKEYKNIYNDLVNHKDTPDTNDVMTQALEIVKNTEDKRVNDRKHFDRISPSIHNGRKFPYTTKRW